MIIIGFLLQGLVVGAWLVVVGRVLLSWIDPTFQKPVSRRLYALTEPVLEPIRRVLPRTGNFDLAPLLLLLGLGLVMRFTLALT